jgi:hypothetical protein
MDANTPAWLQANTTEAVSSSSPSVPVAGTVTETGTITSIPVPAPPTPAQLSAAAAAAENDDDPDLPGVILMMRLANIGVAGALMAISVSYCGFSSLYSVCCACCSCRYSSETTTLTVPYFILVFIRHFPIENKKPLSCG